MSGWIEKNALLAYSLLAYAISWAFMLPVALAAQGLVEQPVPYALYYLAPMGPMASAITIEAATGRREGLLGRVDYLPHLGIPGVLGIWFLTFGLGEEVGWRGFALPRLQRGRSALSATVILALLWGLWHLPAFFFRDTYMEMGPLGIPMFLISIFFASVVFTWLYNSTGGSVLMPVLFHVFFDWLSVSKAGGAYTPTVMSVAVIVWALFVARRYSPETLSPLAKHAV